MCKSEYKCSIFNAQRSIFNRMQGIAQLLANVLNVEKLGFGWLGCEEDLNYIKQDLHLYVKN